jgi:glutamate-1-semialdehyde 2,1-aminomutase
VSATPTATDLEQLVREYRNDHPKSAALHATALDFFAARGATHFARVQVPFRPYITHAKGTRKWDVDGREYIDYVMGHGALMLGHGHPAIVAAVQAQVEKGLHYGDNHPLELEWATLIRRMMPTAERVEFTASGQEANAIGIRLARAVTGRKKVLRIKGNYHGWLDELANPELPGVVAPEVELVPPNDLTALDDRLSKGDIAVLLVEGGGGFLAGRIPAPALYYKPLPEMARKYGTIFMLDEVVTGFREHSGGWSAVCDIKPDLTSIGKAVSAGMASGALIGRADLFTPLDPDRAKKVIPHGGTWNAVPISAAAGIAACNLYLGGAPQRAAGRAGQAIREGCNDVLERRGVSGRVYGRSVLHNYFGPIDTQRDAESPNTDFMKLVDPAVTKITSRLDLHLLQRGIASLRGEVFMLSGVHTQEDIEKTVTAFDQSIAAMLEEGTLRS